MTCDPRPLSDIEMEELSRLVDDRNSRTALNLLAFGGVDSASGLMARLVIAELPERTVLVTAIRRAIRSGKSAD